MAQTLTQLLLRARAEKIPKREIERARALRVPSLNAVETSYRSDLLRVQSYINKETVKTLKARDLKNKVLRHDGISELIQEAFAEIGALLTRTLTSGFLSSGILRAAAGVVAVNDKKYDTKLYKELNINALPSQLGRDIQNNWIKDNVSLITNTNARQAAQLESLFRRSAFSGMRSKDFEAEIQRIYGGTRKNVALIARDQTHKLNSYLDMYKQTSAGIDGYYWRSSRDERVRFRHAEREGRFYRWDDPPEGGHPGYEFQCRCTAEAAVDKALLTKKEWEQERKDMAAEEEMRRRQAVLKSVPANKREREAREKIIDTGTD